jgi:hypothetical protein
MWRPQLERINLGYANLFLLFLITTTNTRKPFIIIEKKTSEKNKDSTYVCGGPGATATGTPP